MAIEETIRWLGATVAAIQRPDLPPSLTLVHD